MAAGMIPVDPTAGLVCSACPVEPLAVVATCVWPRGRGAPKRIETLSMWLTERSRFGSWLWLFSSLAVTAA